MNNEIKEILDYLSDDSKSFIICGVSYYKISDYKAKILLNCITNLQEEIKSANESITWWTNRFNAIERDYKDYKSKCEKLELENKLLKEQMVAMVQPKNKLL